MLFVCIIMHTPPNASSNTVNNTVIFIGIPAFLIIARPFDISNKYDINKPAVLLCEKCIYNDRENNNVSSQLQSSIN